MKPFIHGRGTRIGLAVSLALFSALLTGGQAQSPASAKRPAAQQQPPAQAGSQQQAEPETPAIKITVQRVNVSFVVVNSKNRYVTDLGKGDFTVFEDGKKVPIDFFVPMKTLPLRAGLLMDTSNSIRLQWGPMQEAAIDFVHTLLDEHTRHKAFLMTFDSTRELVKDFTSDPNDLADALRKLKPGGGTSLFDAIYHACADKLAHESQPSDVRRVLLVISDGEDDASKYSIQQTIDVARRAEVSIYAISTVSYNQASPGDSVLRRITEQTGGYVVYPWKKPPSAEYGTGYTSNKQIGNQNAIYEVGTGQYAGELARNLATSLAQIHKELTSQYVIGYRPPNPVSNGKFREVKVEPRNHDYHVRARKGYVPPFRLHRPTDSASVVA